MFTLVVTLVLVVVVGAVLVDLLYGPEQPATPGALSDGAQWEPWPSLYRSLRVRLAGMVTRARWGLPAAGRRVGRSTRRLVTATVAHVTELGRVTRRSLTTRRQARAARHAAHARHQAHIEHVEALMQVPNAPPPSPEATPPPPTPAEPVEDPSADGLPPWLAPGWNSPPTVKPVDAGSPVDAALDAPAAASAPAAPVPAPTVDQPEPEPEPSVPEPEPVPVPVPTAATTTWDPGSPPPAPPPLRRSMLPGLVTPPGGVSAARPPAPMLDYGAGEVITGEHPIPVRPHRGPAAHRGPGRDRARPDRPDTPARDRAHRRPRAQGHAPEGAIVPLQMSLPSRLRALAVLSLVSIVVGVLAAAALVTVIVIVTRALAHV